MDDLEIIDEMPDDFLDNLPSEHEDLESDDSVSEVLRKSFRKSIQSLIDEEDIKKVTPKRASIRMSHKEDSPGIDDLADALDL
jgi:hypothetical protein